VRLVNVAHLEGMDDTSAERIDHWYGEMGSVCGLVLLPCLVCRGVEGFLDFR
jgi:hypothetical protein